MASRKGGSKGVVYAALAGNLAIAVIKFVAAVFTGSSAMLSEGVHSLVDTLNEVLLLYGMRRAERPPDAAHPLGYSREIYFWSFIVALLVFALGAGVSLYEGVTHILDPRPVENIGWSLGVLAASAIFEGIAWTMALREMLRVKGSATLLEAVRRSKDPTTFTVLFEDSAALLGLLVAAASILSAHVFAIPELDGVGSIGIAVILASTAIFLARESKALLIGEPAYPSVQRRIVAIAEEEATIEKVHDLITVHLGPDDVVATIGAEFSDELRTPDIEGAIDRIATAIRRELPQVTAVFIRPQSTAGKGLAAEAAAP